MLRLNIPQRFHLGLAQGTFMLNTPPVGKQKLFHIMPRLLKSKLLLNLTNCSNLNTSSGGQQNANLNSEGKIKTMAEVIECLFAKVGVPKEYKEVDNRQHLMELLPKSQADLPFRTMNDSKDTAIIPLESDFILREKYLTFLGGVRIGRLLEDLDVFAVWLCYLHILNPLQKENMPSPYSIVTALVDRIDFEKGVHLRGDKDIKLEGHISWVGKSSIESTVIILQKIDGIWQKVTRAVFVMVARDPLNLGSAVVNPLLCETQEDKDLFHVGEISKMSRKLLQQESLFKVPPNDTEKGLVHNLFMEMAAPDQCSFAPKNKPENSVWMDDTKLKNLIICHPEHRNRFGKIFGGFIMRQAFELSWACAFVYSKQRPTILHVDDILFRKPVEIGSLLYLSSEVVYTEKNHIQISTKASVVDAVTRTSYMTNIFQLTFEVENLAVTCIPNTYHEAMMYLDGRRHYQLVRGIKKFYAQGEKKKDTVTF